MSQITTITAMLFEKSLYSKGASVALKNVNLKFLLWNLLWKFTLNYLQQEDK